MFSKFFIERPILANVIAYLIIILGVVAVYNLPVAQYPEITPPTVQVTTRLPGASAQIIADTVALPIEQSVNGVEKMLYMQSTSANDGSYKLTVTFEVGTDLDFAQVLVQNRVASALPKLPPEIQAQGVVTKKVSTAILQVINLYSTDNGSDSSEKSSDKSSKKRYDSLYLSNYAYINLRDVISRLPGVGDVNVFGFGEYAMRIWLNPDKLKAQNLVPTDVINAVSAQNIQVPAGQIGAPPAPDTQEYQYTVTVKGRLVEVEEFEDIIVKSDGNKIVRIKDVGRVDLGAQTYSQFCTLNGDPSAGMAIFQLPGANALDVAKRVNDKMVELSKNFPEGLSYKVSLDTTLFTKASINEVYKTLFEAAILVLAVILLFLQNWRAVLVPATTVPVTIIGAFIAMSGLGFTVNMVTLFALVLAIGVVVDDAIVIVEGAAHGVEKGMTPKDATIQAMKELIGPVIGITLVLMAVFLPAAFLPGITGQLYNQFALVIASTAFISAINAVTLKPVQCSQYLRPQTESPAKFYQWFNRCYKVFEDWYVGIVGWALRNAKKMMVVYALLMALTVYIFVKTPTGFLPEEDQGYGIVAVQLPDGSSLNRTEKVMAEVSQVLKTTKGIANFTGIGGISVLDNSAPSQNAGVFYVIYDDYAVRSKTGESQKVIFDNLRMKFTRIEDAIVGVFAPPAIQGLGVASGFQMMLQSKGGFKYQDMLFAVNELVKAGKADGRVQGLASFFRPNVPIISTEINRVMAHSLGVNTGDIFKAIQTYLGSYFINQFNQFGRTYQVYVQADSEYRLQPDDVRKIYVRNKNGEMVSLGAVTDVQVSTGPGIITLYNLYPTAQLNGAPAPGYSSGEALKLMEDLAQGRLGKDIAYEWTGMSYQEKLVGNQALYVFALSILLVFLVLAAQYESWSNPVAVVLSVPLALLGTMTALNIRGFDNNVYTQIGLILLIALASKNAILIVEVAREERAKGMGLIDAAMDASRRRLRPILMTSLAFILGVAPLVVAEGAGSASRQALGTAVFGGMLASTFLAVFFVPVFWVLIQKMAEQKNKSYEKESKAEIKADHS